MRGDTVANKFAPIEGIFRNICCIFLLYPINFRIASGLKGNPIVSRDALNQPLAGFRRPILIWLAFSSIVYALY